MKEINGSNNNSSLRIKIDAFVVRQLGEELISDAEQAILELVKNSYDADSDWCAINIDTNYKEIINGIVYQGKITIEDQGIGMTREQISKGWLTISYSEKRELKRKKIVTDKHNRSYQGDKGLGRLSSMKLGSILRLTTSHGDDNNPSFSIQLNWDDFLSGTTLDNISVEEVDGDIKNTGTRLDIIGLHDIKRWQGNDSKTNLQIKLSSLISPFNIDEQFKVYLSIDGDNIDFAQLTSKALQTAIAKFNFSYKDNILKCVGKIKLPYFMGGSIETQSHYDKYIKPDAGYELFNEICNATNLSEYEIKKLDNKSDNDWFIEFQQEFNWSDITPFKVPYESPGDFTSEWNYVFFGSKAFKMISESAGLNIVDTNLLKNLAGIGVYKGNFRVGKSDDDWLGLSKDKTAGEGFYSLRPDNTIGFFHFSGYAGESLKEKSDRQGFVENASYNGFMSLSKRMIKFSNQFLNRSRRANLTFLDKKRLFENKKPETYKAEDAILEIRDLTLSAKARKSNALKSSFEASQAIELARKSIDSALNDLLLDDKARQDIFDLKKQVSLVNEKFSSFNLEYEGFLNVLSNHEISADKILSRLNQFEKQIDDFYDFAAIGLAAQNLAHEINPQLDNISINSNKIKDFLKRENIKNRDVYNQINVVIRTTQVIAKDVTLINPMLRSRRELVDEFDLVGAFKDYISLRSERFSSKSIKFNVKNESKSFSIKFNKGKFTQVIDNLVRNSEYWLEHFYESNQEDKNIFIEITERGFIFWDAGPGIRQGMDQVLFEMFTTDKTNGQGLGLFITTKILGQQGCKVILLDEVNLKGRKFKFYVDLCGAIIHGK